MRRRSVVAGQPDGVPIGRPLCHSPSQTCLPLRCAFRSGYDSRWHRQHHRPDSGRSSEKASAGGPLAPRQGDGRGGRLLADRTASVRSWHADLQDVQRLRGATGLCSGTPPCPCVVWGCARHLRRPFIPDLILFTLPRLRLLPITSLLLLPHTPPPSAHLLRRSSSPT